VRVHQCPALCLKHWLQIFISPWHVEMPCGRCMGLAALLPPQKRRCRVRKGDTAGVLCAKTGGRAGAGGAGQVQPLGGRGRRRGHRPRRHPQRHDAAALAPRQIRRCRTPLRRIQVRRLLRAQAELLRGSCCWRPLACR
jgi:IS5 family transposase